MKILKIAVTGSAGAGKSLVCTRLKQIGLVTLDCDAIARQVVEPGQDGFNRVVQLFGSRVVGLDGRLDRAELRRMIVNDEALRRKMEAILHPMILAEMMFQMDHADYAGGKKAVAVEVPLLFETGMEQYFDATIAVVAEDAMLLNRIADRDNVSQADAGKMLALQLSQKEKMARADHVIKNSGSQTELFELVDNLFAEIEKEFLTT